MVVLIDCGATHNFISLELVRKLCITVTDTSQYGVMVGTGSLVRGVGICKGIVVALPNIEIVDDFLPLTLGCTDLILGIKWLGTLGKMQVHWGLLIMKFKVDGNSVTLQRETNL